MTLRIVPMSINQARRFVQAHHRHHDMPRGGLWALALMRGEELVGVAIAGRPVSALMQRRGYCEVIRCCVLEGIPNGCSMLYGRCRRVAQAMGYSGTITYTLASERGSSLRAAGFVEGRRTRGGRWNCPARRRLDQHPTEPKIRWDSQQGTLQC